MVDFPSLGRVEVIPTILLEALVASESTASLIDRIDSANRDNGMAVAAQYISLLLESVFSPSLRSVWAVTKRNRFFFSGFSSKGTSDRHGKRSVASTCADVRK